MKSIRSFRPAALMLALLLALCQSVLAQTTVSLTRGPYLQTGTPTSITVRWRTDVQTDSCVRYGTSFITCESTLTTEHLVSLSGLVPNTQYYYSIGTSAGSIAGGDSTYFFLTAPVTGTAKPTRIWVLGDSGTAGSSARAVRDAYLSFTGTRHTDLWLMLGDNAYPDSTDSDYQASVFNMYPTVLRKSVLWPTFGNHEAHTASSSSQSGPYYDIFTLPKNGEAGGIASGTEAYYSFNYGNIHFVCLDSQGSDRSPSGAMLTWLKADLAANTQQWLVAFWHAPPYSKGSHDSDSDTELKQMRQYALPILEDYGVDLVLSGHSHSYERSYLLDGHYGDSSTLTSSMIVDAGDGRADGTGAYQKPALLTAHKGAVYTVAGSSGMTGGGLLNHPAMYVSLNVLGSLVLDINGNQLDAKFLTNTGSVPDHFTILKGGSGTASPTITSFTPTSGPGGTAVTITGSNFTGATQVTFNGTPASLRIVSDTQINTTVPSGATTGKIRVTTPAGFADSASAFTVTGLPPTISSFSPSSGPVGTAVTITGSNFTGATQVTFNSVAAALSVVSNTQINTTVPSGATTGKIRVTTPAGFADSASAFTVTGLPPTISSFTPTSGPGGTAVTITGTNFVTGATQVAFNGTTAGLNGGADTQINTSVPGGATSGKIRVTTPAGFVDSASAFTVTGSSTSTSVEVRVSAGADDAEEQSSGTVSLTSSDLELVYDGNNQTVGMRFNGVTIPPGATIVNAYVQFQVDETNSEPTALTIKGQAIDTAPTFTTATKNVTARTRTAAAVAWSPPAWTTVGAAGPDQQTPSITSVIQEIVSRPGWSSGNSLVVIINGTGHRTAKSYDGSKAGAPLLHVEYKQ